MSGAAVSGLDLDLLQSLFAHQNLQLLLRRDESPDPEELAGVWPDLGDPADLLTWTTGTTGRCESLIQQEPNHPIKCTPKLTCEGFRSDIIRIRRSTRQ